MSILIVEDTKPMRDLMVSVLDTLGLKTIFKADNGETGFEQFQEHNPDIVLSDWLMEPLDGLELTKMIRTDKESVNPYAPIILVTGFTSLNRVQKARDLGVTEFLVKPFTAHDMAQRIAYIINKPRDFIKAPNFFGPDRRRTKSQKYNGPFRRETDKK